jgi:hypothetical protein
MNIEKSIFILWVTWYFYIYGPPKNMGYFLNNLYNFLYIIFNKLIHPDFEPLEVNIYSKNNDIKEESTVDESKVTPKYEDKYLEDIRSLNREWDFTVEENNIIFEQVSKLFCEYKENKLNRIEKIQQEIKNLENEISEDNDTNDDLNKINNVRRDHIKNLQEEYELLDLEVKTEKGLDELKKQCEIEARKNIVNKRLNKLENCYIIEKTPIGNVLMIYEKEKETFKYYSDCNIPYRYLDVVGRKYVKLFDCRPIFVDMEEELRLFEEKWEKEQELIKIREEENKKTYENQKSNNEVVKKKNVFAKFKSYNKDAGGKISMAPPPKNSIPNNKSINENKENEKILLKERANRYTYEGKFANFNFLKKIDRKIFNKKLGLSFADFKKMKK